MRDCKNCKHLIMYDYKNKSYSCEKWECKFEPKEQEPTTKNDLGVQMTNGEKMQEVFPEGKTRRCKDGVVFESDGWCHAYDSDWWNAEYEEPITENCIACKYDETEEEDGEHCKKCLEGDSQFELDNEFVEATIRKCFGCKYSKDNHNAGIEKCHLCMWENQYTPITDNDLADKELKGEVMDFPNTFDEFAKDYGFKDKDEIYTNGSELIPVFRVKQWLEHISTTKNDLGVDCISRAEAIRVASGYCHPSNVAKELAKLPSMGRYDPYTDKFIKE